MYIFLSIIYILNVEYFDKINIEIFSLIHRFISSIILESSSMVTIMSHVQEHAKFSWFSWFSESLLTLRTGMLHFDAWYWISWLLNSIYKWTAENYLLLLSISLSIPLLRFSIFSTLSLHTYSFLHIFSAVIVAIYFLWIFLGWNILFFYVFQVINEALRMANIVNAVWRKAIRDIEIDGLHRNKHDYPFSFSWNKNWFNCIIFSGYLIPKDWCIMASFSSVHFDEENYPNPYEFNPWRWEVSNRTI